MSIRYYLAAAGLLLAACNNQQAARLPIYGERSAVKTTVDGKEKVDTIYQTIPPFKFVDQTGDTVTNKTLEGKVYVGNPAKPLPNKNTELYISGQETL